MVSNPLKRERYLKDQVSRRGKHGYAVTLYFITMWKGDQIEKLGLLSKTRDEDVGLCNS